MSSSQSAKKIKVRKTDKTDKTDTKEIETSNAVVVKKPEEPIVLITDTLMNEYKGLEIEADPSINVVTDDNGVTTYLNRIRFPIIFIDKKNVEKQFIMDEVFVDSLRTIQSFYEIMRQTRSETEIMKLKFKYSRMNEIEEVLNFLHKSIITANKTFVDKNMFIDFNLRERAFAGRKGPRLFAYLITLDCLQPYHYNDTRYRLQLGQLLREYGVKYPIYSHKLLGSPNNLCVPRITNYGKFHNHDTFMTYWLETKDKTYFVYKNKIVDPDSGEDLYVTFNLKKTLVTVKGKPFKDPKTMKETGENLTNILKENNYFILPEPSEYVVSESGEHQIQEGRPVRNSHKNIILVLQIKNKVLTITFENRLIFSQNSNLSDTIKKIYISDGELKDPDASPEITSENPPNAPKKFSVDDKFPDVYKMEIARIPCNSFCRRRGYIMSQINFEINNIIMSIPEGDENKLEELLGKEYQRWYDRFTKGWEREETGEELEDTEEEKVESVIGDYEVVYDQDDLDDEKDLDEDDEDDEEEDEDDE